MFGELDGWVMVRTYLSNYRPGTYEVKLYRYQVPGTFTVLVGTSIKSGPCLSYLLVQVGTNQLTDET